MKKNDIIHLQSQYLLSTYSASLVLVEGSGAVVKDVDGKEYLDFTSGISVCNVGHCHPTVTKAIADQAGKLVHVSNLYVNELQPQLAKEIVDRSFDGRAFFANSGAEANEGIIKFARKWGSETGRYKIVCMENNFHGRTLAALSATAKEPIRKGFDPLVDGFSFVPYNDLDAVTAAIDDETAAVLLEPIQGEGGVTPADQAYLEGVRAMCDEKGILLLFDEVQTGFGRTGTMFGYQQYGVVPDAMSLAKGIANGYPMGALVVARKWEKVMGPGSHASTFGGTPLACAASLATIKVMDDENVLTNVNEVGAYATDLLNELVAKHACLKLVRGPGLMIGIVTDSQDTASAIIGAAMENSLLLVAAGGGVVRFYPPLNVNKETVKKAVNILDATIGDLS